MQLIFFLLGLFAIGCVLYGISAGVQIIVRGFARLANGMRNNAPKPAPFPPPPVTACAANKPAPTRRDEKTWTSAPSSSPIHRSIDELREIFALYQHGALTQDEFERMKRFLLSNIQTDTPQSRSSH